MKWVYEGGGSKGNSEYAFEWWTLYSDDEKEELGCLERSKNNKIWYWWSYQVHEKISTHTCNFYKAKIFVMLYI